MKNLAMTTTALGLSLSPQVFGQLHDQPFKAIDNSRVERLLSRVDSCVEIRDRGFECEKIDLSCMKNAASEALNVCPSITEALSASCAQQALETMYQNCDSYESFQDNAQEVILTNSENINCDTDIACKKSALYFASCIFSDNVEETYAKEEEKLNTICQVSQQSSSLPTSSAAPSQRPSVDIHGKGKGKGKSSDKDKSEKNPKSKSSSSAKPSSAVTNTWLTPLGAMVFF